MTKEKQIMKLSRITYVIAMALFASANVWAQSGGYKVVVNPANPAVSISKDDLSRIFQKQATKFRDGRGASPVDLPVGSPVRESFSKNVLGKPTSAVDAF